MVYFLVNNNYQYLEAVKHANILLDKKYVCGLILVPHTFDLPIDNNLFANVVKIDTPANKHWLKAWFKYLTIGSKIDKIIDSLQINNLIFFTEFELINQLIAIRAKQNKIPIYLLEDGGIGSYILFTLTTRQKYTISDILYIALTKLIPKLWNAKFTKFDNVVFPMLPDHKIDALISYREYTSFRKIPLHVISRPSVSAISTIPSRVIFLNQPLYRDDIQTYEAYIEGLNIILFSLSNIFKEVFFKFHPREESFYKKKITNETITKFKISVIDSNEPIENILSVYKPSYLASYNSTPLFNLDGTGICPLFLFHLIEDLKYQESFVQTKHLLDLWKISYPTSFKNLELNPSSTNFDRSNLISTNLLDIIEKYHKHLIK